MGIMELLNTIVLVVGITFGLMLVSQTIIRARGEEYRKNEDLATKLTDRIMKSIKETMIETFTELKNLEENKTVKQKTVSEKIKVKMDSEFEN